MAFFDFDDIEEEFKRIQERMNKLFAEMRKPFFEAEPRKPVVRMQETPQEIVVTFELPGVEKKDISLEVTENRIKVKAARKKAEEVKKKGFYKAFREARTFYHEETLPAKIVPEETKAEYKEGVLKVTLPKEKVTKVTVKKVKIK